MGITILVENVWGNAEACILKLYKNVSGIKQARPRFPRHSYPTGKYLAIIKICPAMTQLEPIGSIVLLSDMAMSLRITGIMLNAEWIEYKHSLMTMLDRINLTRWRIDGRNAHSALAYFLLRPLVMQ